VSTTGSRDETLTEEERDVPYQYFDPGDFQIGRRAVLATMTPGPVGR
jgi:hypothetical protein